MSIDARLDVIGLVVADMAASLAFYRRLGLDLPADADSAPHVELELPGGLRLTWDTEATIRSFAPIGSHPRAPAVPAWLSGCPIRPRWTPPTPS